MIVPVVRVYGIADQFSLEFENVDGNDWDVRVPIDTVDGIYACEIYAVDIAGGTDVWTGLLYVHNGSACLRFVGKGRAVEFFADGLKTQFVGSGVQLVYYNGGGCA